MMQGKLYIVATPIGNLDDMTLRALKTLSDVDLIAAEDTRHTRKLLTHFKIRTELTSYFQGKEREKAAAIIGKLKGGSDVALVSDAGTPCISDPGYPLLVAAIEEGIDVIPIPGASALAAAISAAGLPTDAFTFVGFLPDKPGKRRKRVEGLADVGHTIVLYVSKYKAERVLEECLEVLGDRRACLCRELTKVHEEFVRAPLTELLAHIQKNPPKGEMTLVVAGRK
jgi:16S rRNA (cytidine1402-2'-O)-methyltransferase